ncbi:hypothetical protein PMAYCL1PPCAC_32141, partial [Pristionchus mayeri]
VMSVIVGLGDTSSHLGETNSRAFNVSHLQLIECVIVGRRRRGLTKSRLVGRQWEGYGKSSFERLLLGHGERQLGRSTSSTGWTLAPEVNL